jgi:hypothetical protein
VGVAGAGKSGYWGRMRIIAASVVLVGFVALGCAIDVAEPARETGEVETDLRAGKLAYEQVDITAAPPEYDFWGPTGVSNHGDVYGTGFACDDEFIVCSLDLLKLDSDGEFSVVASDFSASEVNGHGDVGGCVVTDFELGLSQAAIVHANGNIELVPPLPGEISSCVIQMSDAETAVVISFDETFAQTIYVRRNQSNLAFPLAAQIRDVNDHGVVAGILSTEAGERAYRFDSRTQTTTILEPVAGDPHSWGLGINRRGDVLGYSFIFDGVERIGNWNRSEEFETHFVEGTPEFPTISNDLIWNEGGVIVVSFTLDENTYVVPEPGVRLNLQDLVGDAVVPSTLLALDINDGADFVAASIFEGTSFLYRRAR